MVNIKKIEVPFDQVGNQMHQANAIYGSVQQPDGTLKRTRVEPDWRKQEGPVDAAMEFVSIYQNSSGVTRWKNHEGKYFWMSHSEFERIIPFMERGILKGKFYFHKQGTYFSLRYLDA